MKKGTYEKLVQLRDEAQYMAKIATKTRNDSVGGGDLDYPADPTEGEVLYLCSQLLLRVADVLDDALTELGDECDE